MSNLELFLTEDFAEVTEHEQAISPRFKDKEGNPIKFKFKAITASEDNKIKAKCTIKKKVNGKQEQDFLAGKYQTLFTIASMSDPDLKNAQLQNKYGVLGEEALFDKLFKPAEALEAFYAAQIANGYDQTFEELVEEAKN